MSLRAAVSTLFSPLSSVAAGALRRIIPPPAHKGESRQLPAFAAAAASLLRRISNQFEIVFLPGGKVSGV
jgi:hypothetical protein